MKKGIQLVALLLTVVMSSCTGGKDKAAVKQEDEKPRVKVADVTARPVDQIQDYTATVEAEVKNNIAPSSPVRIDRILDVRQAASLKAGGQGIRYVCEVEGSIAVLFHDEPYWFIEREESVSKA